MIFSLTFLVVVSDFGVGHSGSMSSHGALEFINEMADFTWNMAQTHEI